MKQTIKIFAVSAIIAVFVLPNFRVLFLPIPVSANQAIQLPVVQLVRVVTLPATATMSLASSQSQASACQAKSAVTPNLAQDAGVVNLNQPADCFSLRIGSVSVTQTTLNVRPLAISQPKIFVAQTRPVLSAPDISQSSPAQTLPIIPASAAVIFMALELFERKLKAQSPLFLKTFFSTGFNPEQLLVLRC